MNPPVGTQLVFLDGSTATVPGKAYPTIVLTMTIQPGATNSLPYQPHLHAQKARNFLDISNSGTQRVLTDPEIPGFQMTIASGVTITGWDGQPNQVVSVRTVPADRLPIPPPPPQVDGKTVYMFYFNKQGGGVPSSPIPVTLPNDLGLLPGDEAALWYFDEAPDGSRPNAWAMAGTMSVSPDGQRLITNPGVGIPRFCCGALLDATYRINTPRSSRQVASNRGFCCTQVADPVELATGLVVLTQTDLVLPGRLPIQITRTQRTNDPSVGPFGRGTTWAYDVDLLDHGGALFTLIFPGNARAFFSLQADGSYQNLTEPSLRGARLTVESGSQRYVLRFKDGTTWFFNSARVLTEIRDRNGNGIRLDRDGSYRVSRLTDAAGRTIEVTWEWTPEHLDRIISIRDPLNRTVAYTYTAAGYLETVTDPMGGITRYTYDANNRLQTMTDPRGTTVATNEYDAAGRLSRQTQADGGIWQIAYTTAGGLIIETRVTDPRGNLTISRFNPGGYLLSQTDRMGQTTQTPRATGINLVTSRTDPLGRETQYTYDANGNLLATTDPLNNTRSFTYDPTFNQLTSRTDPLGNRTTFEYDASGNLTAITDTEQNTMPEGQRLKTTFTYNQYGQPLTSTDPLGNTTTFTYDEHGNLLTVTDPLGNRTERTYDSLSRLLRLKDPKGAVTQFSYDVLDGLVSIIDPLGGVTRFSYDPNGNPLSVTDAKGQTTTHTYDLMNRLETRTDPLNRIERFAYDGNGNLATVTDRKNQVTTLIYDGQNRRTRTEYADGSSVGFSYDAAGNLLTATDSVTGTVTRSYDPINRLVSESSAQGTIVYAYDGANRRSQMQVSGLQPVTYAYDPASRLTGVAHAGQAATLTYDPSNRRTSLVLPNRVTVTYTYDEANHLIAQTYSGPQGGLGYLTYQYDASGNRISTGGSWARSLLPSSVLSSNYDQASAQLAFGEVTQTFDLNGNVFTQTDATGTTSYIWDARNRLITISGPTVNASFSYDALGRRISKTITGQTTTFHYDGLDAIRESGSVGETTYLRPPAIDEVFTRTDASGPSSFLADILGSTVALTDSTASVATVYTYDPFGLTQVSGSTSANPLQFTERENDGTGLYFYRARYYDPQRGRFTGPDPLRTGGGGNNLYAYANNNPTIYVDPMGLQSCILGSDDCTRSAGRELERRPIADWFFDTSRVVGPAPGPGRGYHQGTKGSLLPTYTIYCYWKRKVQVTYSYTETCTYYCTDDCRKPWVETSTWETTIEREELERKRTEGVLTILSGWGGSPDLANTYCVRNLRP